MTYGYPGRKLDLQEQAVRLYHAIYSKYSNRRGVIENARAKHAFLRSMARYKRRVGIQVSIPSHCWPSEAVLTEKGR